MSPANLLIESIYYIIIGILTLFSVFGVYILLRYGRSLPLAFFIALAYSLFFLKILAESYQTLHTLLT